MWYLWIGAGVGVLSLLLFIAVAIESSGDTTELTMMIVLAFCGAMMAGLLWPIALATGGIVLAVKQPWKEYDFDFSLSWDKGNEKTETMSTDSQKYRQMARDERAMAHKFRKDVDLSTMHENLAKQYESLAAIYEKGKEEG